MANNFCPFCGKPITIQGKFCAHCGRAIKEKPKRPLSIYIAVGILVITIAYAFFFPAIQWNTYREVEVEDGLQIVYPEDTSTAPRLETTYRTEEVYGPDGMYCNLMLKIVWFDSDLEEYLRNPEIEDYFVKYITNYDYLETNSLTGVLPIFIVLVLVLSIVSCIFFIVRPNRFFDCRKGPVIALILLAVQYILINREKIVISASDNAFASVKFDEGFWFMVVLLLGSIVAVFKAVEATKAQAAPKQDKQTRKPFPSLISYVKNVANDNTPGKN